MRYISASFALLVLCMTLLHGNPVFAADIQSGTVLNFNGVDGFVNVPNNTLLEPVDEMSFEIWAYQDSWLNSTTNSALLDRSDYGSSGYALLINRYGSNLISAQIRLAGHPSGYVRADFGTSGLSDGWHHFAATFDGQYIKLYVDGNLQTTTDAGGSYDIESIFYHQPLWFGKRGSDNAYFTGKLDEARIYSRDLSALEVTAHYNAGLGDLGSAEAGLVGAWHFDEGSGLTASDYSGNSFNGGLSGGVTWGARVIPPNTISNLSIASFGTTTATITWDTSEASDSIVHYGLTSSYGSTVMSSTTGTGHSLSLTGLTATTTYHFKVYSFDGSDMAVSSDATFKTLDFDPTDNIFYAAPNGSSLANGAKGSPWDLYSALRKTSVIQPGGTLYLRGGTYLFATSTGQLGYESHLAGTQNNPIVVRSYPGEWAILDGTMNGVAIKNTSILNIYSDYTWYRDFEITNSETTSRKISVSGSNPTERRANSTNDYGDGNKLINLLIHNTGQGIGAWQNGQDGEYYGNIVFNNGWDAPDRGHGKGIYTQNQSGYKRVQNNIMWNDFSLYTLRTGGTDDSAVRGYLFEGNTLFNGSTALEGPQIDDLKIFHNYTWNHGFGVGYEPTNTSYHTANVKRNYFTRGLTTFNFYNELKLKYNTVINALTGGGLRTVNYYYTLPFSPDYNTYYNVYPNDWPYWAIVGNAQDYAFNQTQGNQVTTYGYTGRSWQDDLGFDLNSTFYDDAQTPTTTVVYYRKNKYDPNLLYVSIYNWESSASVSIDPSLVLDNGDSYQLISVQDYFDDVTTGTYNGSSLSVAMTGRTYEDPIGYSLYAGNWYHDPNQLNGTTTFPRFGAFIIKNTSGTTDIAAPVISNITEELASQATTTIWWETNEDSTTRLEYGLTTAYGSASTTDNLGYHTPYTTFHEVTLYDLLPGTTYHYRLVTEDYSGNSVTSDDYTFTTTGTAPTPEAPAPAAPSGGGSRGGGGGGGGGGTTAPVATTTATTTCTTIVYPTLTTNLALNSLGTEVTTLKKILTAERLLATSTTAIYDLATVRAVEQFQTKYGIATVGVPGYGKVGPKTRTFINARIQQRLYPTLGVCLTLIAVPRTATTTAYTFTRTLSLGSTGPDVKALQIYLNTHGFPISSTGIGSPGRESTYFGPATKAALIKFQIAKGITPTSGIFGAKTRMTVNTN